MKNKAVFLDRDRVIFEEVDHLYRVTDAKFITKVKEALLLVLKEYKIFDNLLEAVKKI